MTYPDPAHCDQSPRQRVRPVFLVRIDLGRLRATLAVVDGRARTNDEAFDWLLARGFRLGRGGGWYARSDALSALPRVAIRGYHRLW